MSGIQLVLITGVALLLFYYGLRLRNALIDLIVLFALGSTTVFFILLPDLTTKIAHRLNVGRGADLLFYCCILLFAFVALKLFARLKRIEKKLTEVTRDKAIEKAILFNKPKEEE